VPYQHIDVPPAATGEAMAAALQRGGAQFQQVGNEFAATALRAQDIQNQTASDSLMNSLQDYAQKAQYGDPNDPSQPGYFSLKGENAVRARANVENGLNSYRQQLEDSAPNSFVKHFFAAASRRYTEFALNAIGRHYDAEYNTYATTQQQATIDLQTRGAALDYNDPDHIAHITADALAAAQKMDDFNGASDEVRQLHREKVLGGIATARIEGALQRDPETASRILEENKGRLVPSEYARLGSLVHTKLQTQGAANFTSDYIKNVDAYYDGSPQAASGDIKTAILGRESGNNDNAPVSVDNAHGPGQIIPETFARFAHPGENIDNPDDNRAVSSRYIDHLANLPNVKGQPDANARIAVGYHSGEGNIAPPGSPTPWIADKKDGLGTHVSQYVSDIQKRLGPAVYGQPAAVAPTSFQTKAEFYEQHQGEIIANAEKAAALRFPDDPVMQDRAVKQVSEHVAAQIRQDKAAEAQVKNRVEQAVNGTLSKGQKPQTMADLRAIVPHELEEFERRDPIGFRALDNVLKANGKTDTGYGDGFYSLLSQVYQHQVTDPTKLFSYVDQPTGITSSGLGRLSQEMQKAGSPEGAAEAAKKLDFINMARAQITQTNEDAHTIDPKGDKEFGKFLTSFLAAYDRGRSQEKPLSVDDMLDPKSPHYLGKMIASYAPTQSEDITKRVSFALPATPEYEQNYRNTSSAEALAAGWKARIEAEKDPTKRAALWDQALNDIKTRFPKTNKPAAAAPPQAPLAQ
jgi:hypothetical protein